MERIDFGKTRTGEQVSLYTLGSLDGVYARITNWGGIITELHVPDCEGNHADVVLGFDSIEPYLYVHPYFGAIVGRVSGRITKGHIELDGESYDLAINNSPNHVHGGLVGLDKKLWEAEVVGETLKLTCKSPDGEEGYPGNVEFCVKYSIVENCALKIEYEAVTDKATPICLTNHSYFNLAGHDSGDVFEHELQINADEVIPMESDFTLSGKLCSVEGTVDDFREPVRFGDRVDHLHLKHGANYFLQDQRGELVLVGQVCEPVSGRVMEVTTSETCAQLYSSFYNPDLIIGKGGSEYRPCAGICIECQGYPDAPNQPQLPSTIIRPGEVYQQTTVYKFSSK